MIAFLYYFSAIGALVSISLLFPALVAFGFEENDAGILFLFYGAIGLFMCGATLLSVMGRPGKLERSVTILLAVFSWFALPMVLALPISHISQIDISSAIFEAVSGFTTTGASSFANLETVPKSILFYRAQLQWMGGVATLVTAILVLAPWKIGGLPQVGAASVAASIISSQQRVTSYALKILRVFAILTTLCFVALLMTGLDPYSASIMSMTALSTGGFLPSTTSPDILLGQSGMIIFTVFLLIGATSIFWHELIVRLKAEELIKHRESNFVLIIFVIVSAFLAYRLTQLNGGVGTGGVSGLISEAAFNSASIISTSGIESRPGIFSILPATIVLLLAMVGAGSYSTSGGIKYFRVGGMYSMATNELERLIHPHVVPAGRLGSVRYNGEFVRAIWSLFTCMVVIIGAGFFLLCLTGMSFQASFTAMLAAISNAGPLYSLDWVPAAEHGWVSYPDMGAFQKTILAVTMILGRLEIVVVVAVINLILSHRR